MLFAIVFGVPLGIIAAVKQGKWPDHLARFVSLLGTSMPVFWLGLLLAYLVTYKFQILPRSGQLDVGMRRPPQVTGFISIDALLNGDTETFRSLVRHIILPAVVLGSFAMGIISRMLRSSLVSALNDDYVRTARAKGVSEYQVVRRHALRNALIPTITVIGLTFASLLAGAVLTETIFSWPGLGQFSVRMALKLDYPGLIGVTLVVAVVYIIVNSSSTCSTDSRSPDQGRVGAGNGVGNDCSRDPHNRRTGRDAQTAFAARHGGTGAYPAIRSRCSGLSSSWAGCCSRCWRRSCRSRTRTSSS